MVKLHGQPNKEIPKNMICLRMTINTIMIQEDIKQAANRKF